MLRKSHFSSRKRTADLRENNELMDNLTFWRMWELLQRADYTDVHTRTQVTTVGHTCWLSFILHLWGFLKLFSCYVFLTRKSISEIKKILFKRTSQRCVTDRGSDFTSGLWQREWHCKKDKGVHVRACVCVCMCVCKWRRELCFHAWLSSERVSVTEDKPKDRA